MIDIEQFIAVSIPPKDDTKIWLQDAAAGVDYVVANSKSDDVILYALVGQTYIHSVLGPLKNLNSPNLEDLQSALVDPDSSWGIEHQWGGGKKERMYLAAPFESPGCDSLVGGEQLVYRRRFDGVDKDARIEVSQRMVHALNLYWRDEEKAFCRLNEDGDVEPIIRFVSMTSRTGESNEMIVTINAGHLHKYMAVTEMALVMKFDFTRFHSGEFGGWNGRGEILQPSENLLFHTDVQSGCSYANGVLVVLPAITQEQLIAESRREWSREDMQYATFKARDWKNKQDAEISCAPSALASYFEKSPLPFQVTPAFFKPEVLQKYKADSEKYRLENRSISSRAGWYLKTYDVNDAGQVHTYLCYLGDLPYSEQLYWQSFNEWPKSDISKRAYETDIQGKWTTIKDPLVELKLAISKLDKKTPDWWLQRGDARAANVHYALTASPDEWANSILTLDQLVVEGFSTKGIRDLITGAGKEFDNQWASLRLIQEFLVAKGMLEVEAVSLLRPLKELHGLRSKVKGHSAETEKQELIKKARTDHGSLKNHFKDLVSKCEISFNRIVAELGPSS
ncbi:MAG: hypothetical protein K2Y39_06260 [Candidatus Obscuribacterales bacterium]|nr:hypothetical protein [Candidatus Obscuribacterales bacterium]